MSGIESGNTIEAQESTPKKVDDSLVKKYEQTNNTLNNIKTQEYIETNLDDLFKDLSFSEQDKQEIVNLVLKRSGDDKKKLDELLNSIKSDQTIFSKINIITTINTIGIKETQTKLQEKETKLQEKETKLQEKETKLQEKETKLQEKETVQQEVKTEKQEKETEKKEAKTENKEAKREEQLQKEKVKNILINLNGENKKDYSEIISLLEQDKLDEVINLLKSSPVVFNSVAGDLQKSDPKSYENYKNTMIGMDSSFREKFDTFEASTINSMAKVNLGTNDLKGVKLSDSTLKYKTDDGYQIEAGNEGRKLSVSGSEYKLDSSLENKEQIGKVDKIDKGLKEKLKPLNEALNSISKVLEYLEKAISNNQDINEVKTELEKSNNTLYNELNISGMNSLADIKNAFAGLYKQKEEEKQKEIKKVKGEIEEIVEQNALKAKELDKNKKDVLEFLHSIGFDLIPQKVTDSIINQLNTNNSIRNLLGFTTEIDLKNGVLGTHSDLNINNISTKEKVDFAKFVNIMISGNIDGPISINTLANDRGSPISNMNEFSTKINQIGLKNEGTATILINTNISDYIQGKNRPENVA